MDYKLIKMAGSKPVYYIPSITYLRDNNYCRTMDTIHLRTRGIFFLSCFRSKLKLICVAIIACYLFLCHKIYISKLFSKLETVQVKANSIHSDDHMKIYDFRTYINGTNVTKTNNTHRHNKEIKPHLDIGNINYDQDAAKMYTGGQKKRILLYMTLRGGSSFTGGLFSTNEEIFYVFEPIFLYSFVGRFNLLIRQGFLVLIGVLCMMS